MQMNKQIEEVFMKYSKPVIIQWLCTQYPVFFKDKKKIIRELNDCKDDIAFEKNHVEINMLIKRRNSLKSENFKDFHDYLLKKITLDKRIHYLLEKQEKFDLLIEDYFDVRKLKRMSRQALDKFREIKMRIEAVCTHRNHHVNKALNKLMCRIIKTVMNYQN